MAASQGQRVQPMISIAKERKEDFMPFSNWLCESEQTKMEFELGLLILYCSLMKAYP